jgi:hypothetical protein
MTSDLANLPGYAFTEERFLPEWRMRRREMINAAVAVVDPQPHQRQACREDVERESMRLFFSVGWMRTKDKSKTKEGKAAAGRLAKALRRLQIALAEPDLDGIVAAAAVTRHFTPEQIAGAVRYCDEVRAARTGKLSRKGAEAKRRAINRAHALLTKYAGHAADDATRGSRFCKLSALLYGDPDIDLHHQCLAALRKLREKPGVK